MTSHRTSAQEKDTDGAPAEQLGRSAQASDRNSSAAPAPGASSPHWATVPTCAPDRLAGGKAEGAVAPGDSARGPSTPWALSGTF